MCNSGTAASAQASGRVSLALLWLLHQFCWIVLVLQITACFLRAVADSQMLFTLRAATKSRSSSRATSRAASLQLVVEAEKAADRDLDRLMHGLSEWLRAERGGMLPR